MTSSKYMAVLLVSDLSRAVDFYVEALGLRVHDNAHGQWAELWCGDMLLALWTGQGDDSALRPTGARAGASGGTFVAVKVDDLQAAIQRVVTHGGSVVQGEVEVSHGSMALTADRDGNPLLLHCPNRPLVGW